MYSIFFINFLKIKNNFINSPYFLSDNNYFFKNFFIFYSFSTFFIKYSTSISIKNSYFKNFLQRCLKISSGFQFGIIEKERLAFQSDILINSKIIDCVFLNCKSNSKGGAIGMSLSTSDLIIKRTGFYKCSSTTSPYSAGAIVVLAAKSVSFFNICFFNCSSFKDPHSIQIAPHYSNSVPYTEMNHSSFSFNGYIDTSSNWGEMIGGTTLLYDFNNISNPYSPSATHGSGLTIVRGTPLSSFGSFSQIINSYGTVFLSFHETDSTSKIFNNWNFINNSCFTNVWIYRSSSSFPPFFEKCNFYLNSNCLTNSGSGTPTFSNCGFSSNLELSNRIGNFIGDNNYNLNFNSISIFNILNTFNCWNKGNNFLISLPFNIQTNYYNLFITLINIFNYEI